MIEVRILKNKEELAVVEIINTEVHPDGTADYQVRFLVERGGAVGLHRRAIHLFPRTKLNVLALLLQALNTLDEKELKLERDFDPDEAPVPSDVARRQRRTLREIQAGISRLHRN